MSGSAHACWKGMKRDDYPDLPDFGDGGACWADWVAGMADRHEMIERAKQLGVAELLTHKTPRTFWFNVNWVPPRQISEAADRMQSVINSRSDDALNFLEIYRQHAVGEKPVEEEFMRELRDVKRIAEFLEQRGVRKMSFEIAF